MEVGIIVGQDANGLQRPPDYKCGKPDESVGVLSQLCWVVSGPMTKRYNEIFCHFGKEWYLPHHPVLNPNKPVKVRRVYNAASKYKDVRLNDKLLTGPNLLHGLIGTIFRFTECPIAITADIESISLQVSVSKDDGSWLWFLFKSTVKEALKIYENQRHVFGAKTSPTSANSALKKVGISNERQVNVQ